MGNISESKTKNVSQINEFC